MFIHVAWYVSQYALFVGLVEEEDESFCEAVCVCTGYVCSEADNRVSEVTLQILLLKLLLRNPQPLREGFQQLVFVLGGLGIEPDLGGGQNWLQDNGSSRPGGNNDF